jgi:hypothetical protein
MGAYDELQGITPELRDVLNAISAGSPADGSITNTKMAADAKVGSLGALSTFDQSSLQAAINEVDGHADTAQSTANGKYTKPGGGIPETDMEAAVSTSLGLADTAYQKPGAGIPAGDLTAAVQTSLGKADAAAVGSGGNKIIGGQVTLGGANPTVVNIMGADVAATLLGTNAEPYNITAAQTFVVNPNGAGDVTATFNGAQGTSTGAAAPSTDISAETDNKFNIAVDGGVATLCTLTIAVGLNSGNNIAAEIQTRVQALGGAFAAVTCAFSGGVYVLTSGTYGTGSSVVITPSATNDISAELKLGVAAGGTEAAGTGDAVNLAATTAAEVATKLAALNGLTAAVAGGAVRITSDNAGAASSLVVNAACALDTVFGITGTDYGEEGLGQAANMADANYRVMATVVKDNTGVTDQLSIGNKAAGSFRIYSETAGSTETVDLIIFGQV